jgi:hypothetical protein
MFELAGTPRELGDIFLQGIALGRLAYRRLFMLTSLIAFLGIVPTAYLVWGAGDTPMTYMQVLDRMNGGYGLVSLALLLASLLARAVLFNRIAAASRGQTYGTTEELQRAVKAWPCLLIAIIVYGLTVVLGTVLLIVPGVILLVSLIFWDYGVVLEGLGPLQALNTSHNLVWGHWWRTLGMLLVLLVPFWVLLSILGALMGLGGDDSGSMTITGRSMFEQGVLEMVALALLAPFGYSILYVYYLDLKLRKQDA